MSWEYVWRHPTRHYLAFDFIAAALVLGALVLLIGIRAHHLQERRH